MTRTAPRLSVPLSIYRDCLHLTLHPLTRQALPKGMYEIIVVGDGLADASYDETIKAFGHDERVTLELAC